MNSNERIRKGGRDKADGKRELTLDGMDWAGEGEETREDAPPTTTTSDIYQFLLGIQMRKGGRSFDRWKQGFNEDGRKTCAGDIHNKE